ncbi:hypothetical protein FJTKL_10753 [Diaporthe vaccinii]|uniref:Uncharacterized protein n=1 Tax=Diaporthe vaccinii TaxID=105482 RepID=A0ABR4FBM2_9PEZI
MVIPMTSGVMVGYDVFPKGDVPLGDELRPQKQDVTELDMTWDEVATAPLGDVSRAISRPRLRAIEHGSSRHSDPHIKLSGIVRQLRSPKRPSVILIPRETHKTHPTEYTHSHTLL